MSTPKAPEPFPLGTEVIVTNGNYPKQRRTATISKVGRTNVYIEIYGRMTGFRKDTGVEVRGNNVGGLPFVIRTQEMFDADERRAGLYKQARMLGFGHTMPKYSEETLLAVIDLLKADPAAPKERTA
jgi:hypothetical protein